MTRTFIVEIIEFYENFELLVVADSEAEAVEFWKEHFDLVSLEIGETFQPEPGSEETAISVRTIPANLPKGAVGWGLLPRVWFRVEDMD